MIGKLALQNFRNFQNKVFEFSDKINIILGPNAVGKTNILESIYLLSLGKSYKGSKDIDLINEGKDFARIKGKIDDLKLEVILQHDKHKKFLLNDVPKRLSDFSGNLKVVLFSPTDLDLITSTPSLRRRFLDNALSVIDREYHRSLISYEKGLRARNKLLLRIREENLPSSQLLFWNQLLIKNADYMVAKREEFISFINNSTHLLTNNYKLIYDKSVISEKRLEDYMRAEIASGVTLVGPHRDDFIFKLNDHDLASFGSRGEQRMGILWLKLGELEFTKAHTLLLDDIFSELDEVHRKLVFDISKNQQTIITTADPEFIENFTVDTKITLGI